MFKAVRMTVVMIVRSLMFISLCSAIGCQNERNIEPELTGPSRVYFSIGIENTVTLTARDFDGDGPG